MTTSTIPQTVLFPDLFDKPLVATFDRRHASSDGGAVLLKAAERVYGLVAGFARCLVDRREPGKIRHTLAELLGQRIFGIACGHPDGNDANHLADDPIHKLLLGRDPVAGEALASQPTISRFENGVGRSALYELGRELAMRVIERHQRRLDGRARRITIDLDPTDDATHGAQQLTFFNGHYDSWCYLPLLAFLTFDQEREQYLCAAVLRPGNVPATRGSVGVLCRLLPLLRQAFPQARFLVRLDGGFATPEIFDFLDAEPRLDYVVAMARNAVLQRHAEPALLVAQAQSAASGQTAQVYADTRYRARTWDRDRRVVIKAEVVRLGDREPRDNPRFVVTNLRQTPRFLYERIYCARGDIENRIKELLDLQRALQRFQAFIDCLAVPPMAVVLVGLHEFFVRTRVLRRLKDLQRWFHSLLMKKLGVDPHHLVGLELISDAVFLEPRIQLFDGLTRRHPVADMAVLLLCRYSRPDRGFDYG